MAFDSFSRSSSTWTFLSSLLQKTLGGDFSDRNHKFASIWDRPGFDQAKLFFEAMYLQARDEQQISENWLVNPPHNVPDANISHTDEENDRLEDEDSSRGKAVPSKKSELKIGIEQDFLDSLAELFAREKPLERSDARALNRVRYLTDTAKHVTATALENLGPEKIRVIIAKNNGLDEKDKEFLKVLKNWISGSSTEREQDGEPEPVRKDVLEFTRPRSEFYIAKILKKKSPNTGVAWETVKATLETRSKNDANTATKVQEYIQCTSHLFDLCENYSDNHSIPLLQDLTSLAYTFRESRSLSGLAKVLREHEREQADYLDNLELDAIFLGRVREGINTLQQFFWQYNSFEIELYPLEVPNSRPIDKERFNSQLSNLPQYSPAREDLEKWQRSAQNVPQVHCEMQVLLYFDELDTNRDCRTSYIGTSKKPCWMCNKILEKYGNYRARGTHGRRVGLWMLDSANPSPKLLETMENFQNIISAQYARISLKDKWVAEKFSKQFAGEMEKKTVLITQLQSLIGELSSQKEDSSVDNDNLSTSGELQGIVDQLRKSEERLKDIMVHIWPKESVTMMQSSGAVARTKRSKVRIPAST